MLRTFLKLVLVVVILVAVGAFALGYWSVGGVRTPAPIQPGTTGTSGHVDVDRARQAGAEIGEKTAQAADRARATLDDTALTAKIKAKMGLDDSVQARHIDVTTNNAVVTLNGTVGSQAERQRAVQLARETAGVKTVVDHLRVR